MRLCFALMLGVTMTACGFGAPDNSPQAQCEQQAMNDPAVVEIYSRTNGAYTRSGTENADLPAFVTNAEALHAAISISQLVVLPKLGHACVVEDPEACVAEIRRFVTIAG